MLRDYNLCSRTKPYFGTRPYQTLLLLVAGGIYNLPSHLSPGARDLIPRMLLVDPLKRITIPEIRCGPGFCAPHCAA